MLKKGLTWKDMYSVKVEKELRKKRKIQGKKLLGLTWEEIHGVEGANKLREKRRLTRTGKKLNRIKPSYKKGKTYEEIYGIERIEEIKEKSKATQLKNGSMWTSESIINSYLKLPQVKKTELRLYRKKGLICDDIIIRKFFGSLDNMAKQAGRDFIDTKLLMTGKTWEERYGKENTILMKQKSQEAQIKSGKVWTRKKVIDYFLKIPIIKRGYWNAYARKGLLPCASVVKRLFGSLDNLADCTNKKFIDTSFKKKGKYETIILNHIEKEKKIKLIRNFSVAKKFIDGYDPINNIAYEVDEPHHKYVQVRDYLREKEIIKVLGCTFVRIDAMDFLTNV